MNEMTSNGPAVAVGERRHQPGRAADAQNGHTARHGRDTRASIQKVAVQLFTEHGYDKTSLREIAEHLDVTKAALYYHFKSKEDIVRSLVEDHYGKIDDLIAWGRQQPRTGASRREILSRYLAILGDSDEVFRMLHENQAAVKSLPSGKARGDLYRERIGQLIELLTGPGAGLAEQLKAVIVLGGIGVAWMVFAEQAPSRGQLADLIREVASDIVIE